MAVSSKSKGRQVILPNLLLSLFSVVMCLLLLEFVVFRLIWPASDWPTNVMVGGLIKYLPNQTGVFRVANEIHARYRINQNGWNSRRSEYRKGKKPGVIRIAVVGDRFVEALGVDFDKSLAEQAEDVLGIHYEVYRFGISGAPLSQYLYMLEKEVISYSPDFVFVNLVHNDFDESYKYVPGRYTSSFLKINLSAWPQVREIPPAQYHPGAVELLRRSAIFRFLVYRQRLNPILIKDILLRDKTRFEANIDVGNLAAEETSMYRAATYLFGRIRDLCRQHGATLIFLMDGVREAIYSGRPAGDAEMLNRIAASAAREVSVRFVDLTEYFSREWKASGKRFEFRTDNHWNEAGHRVAAQAIVDCLRHHSADQWRLDNRAMAAGGAAP